MMDKLYRGRYLIAVFDRNDEYCLGVYESIKQVGKFLDIRFMETIISRSLRTYKTLPNISIGNYNFCFIDIFEQHNDCFKDADADFIKFYEENKYESMADFCLRKQISVRTFARNYKKFKKGEKCKYGETIREYNSRNNREQELER